MFGKFQDMLKKCLIKLQNQNNINKSNNLKRVSTKDLQNGRMEQFNLLESEFRDKSERIKVNSLSFR